MTALSAKTAIAMRSNELSWHPPRAGRVEKGRRVNPTRTIADPKVQMCFRWRIAGSPASLSEDSQRSALSNHISHLNSSRKTIQMGIELAVAITDINHNRRSVTGLLSNKCDGATKACDN
jgi:hypothetical protein